MKKIIIFLLLLTVMSLSAQMSYTDFNKLSDTKKYEYYTSLYQLEHSLPVMMFPTTYIGILDNDTARVWWNQPMKMNIGYLSFDITLESKSVKYAKKDDNQLVWYLACYLGGLASGIGLSLALHK